MENMGTKMALTRNPKIDVEMLAGLYGYEVYKLAYFYLKDKGMAEDITQEVFVTCLEKIDQFYGNIDQAKFWLLKITTNKCKDIFRSWKYKYTLLSDHILDSLKSSEPQQEANLIKKYEKDVLVDKILKLPLKYREMIILFYYQELKINEISDLLEISQNTVKSRLHRGKEKLKHSLKGEY
jgi:RNA polymerase sigma factor (sigma-70 family)